MEAAERFNEQFWKLGGTRPPPPEPERAPEPRTYPEAKKTLPGKTPESDGPNPVPDSKTQAHLDRSPTELFAEGKFAEAARSRGNDRLRSLARFGDALGRALPAWSYPYMIVRLSRGRTQEGFVRESDTELTVMQASGSSMSIPKSLVVGRETIPEEHHVLVATVGNDSRKLLRGAAICFRLGRPGDAAGLLRRIVDADGTPRAIEKEIPPDHRAEIHRAYAEAAISLQIPTPIVKTTPRANPLKKDPRSRPGTSSRLKIKDAQARKLMGKARPLRLEGERLFKKIQLDGLKKADPNDIDQAIRKYEAAQKLYEQAWEREDSDTIYAIVKGCSGRLFRLRFFRDQIGKR